jgi:hypothetical protein
MNKQQLEKKVAQLEFANDQLIAEIHYLDELMRQVGFTEGLQSLKSTAVELFESEQGREEEDKAA